MSGSFDRRMLDLAARSALRGAGDVEPNPLVGAVIVRGGRIIGMGHHRRFGGPHAEVEALSDCRSRGEEARGATMYVTLEPCNHQGKQPACTGAILRAGLTRVVIGRRDPNPVASGGAESLRQAGVEVAFCADSRAAVALTEPFVKRAVSGLPWVIAKWAQTIDGRVATRAGESRWISCEESRRRVHRLRARVDAVLTGMGTVRADDPRLTARGVARVRRVARRVVIDARGELAIGSALVETIDEAPVTLVFDEGSEGESRSRLRALEERGVELLGAPAAGGRIDLHEAIRRLAVRHEMTNLLVEAGPGLLGGLFGAGLVDEARVFVAPMLLGDGEATPAVAGLVAPRLSDSRRFELVSHRRSGCDALLTFRRSATLPP